MVKAILYVEGGSRGKLESECRKGFSAFFGKVGLQGRLPKVIACGSRGDAHKRFRKALSEETSSETPFLLVDSEYPVKDSHSSWQHLQSRDKWQRPKEATEDRAHLMVQCMESWFLADVDALKSYFGNDFRPDRIREREDIENIAKENVITQLKSASQDCKKGAYDKGSHSFAILESIDPENVIRRSRRAKRLIDTLKGYLAPS